MVPPLGGLLRSGVVVGIGLAIEVASQFLRTLVLARLLGASEFGLVASVNMLYSAVDLACFIGIDRYIVFAPHGGGREALDAAHSLSLLRGVVSAAFIFLLAVPTAALLGARDQAAGFSIVAIVPLLRGAMHLGIFQVQRSGRFWPAAAAEAFGALAGLAAATTAAILTRDFTAVLWWLGVQAAGSVLFSHFAASGIPYRCSLDAEQFRGALKFGLPLTGNGLGLALAYQLDRMVIGSWLGVAQLGIYGLSMTIIVQPISLLMRLANTTWQPPLSAAWHEDKLRLFPPLARHIGRIGAALGGAGAAIAMCLGSPLLRVAFGDGYSAPDMFFLLIGGAVLTRLGRGALNLLGLAIGRTSDLMFSNLIGAVALPATIVAFLIQPTLESAALGGLVGEILSYLTLLGLLRPHCAGPAVAVTRDFAVAAIAPLAIGTAVLFTDPGIWARAAAALGAILVCMASLALIRSGSRVDHNEYTGFSAS
jgi:O-antigen/teichoic acid export membrane protein